MSVISLDDVRKAERLLRDAIFKTPTHFSRSASERLKSKVFFKYENQQITGSFKIRGAMNKIASLSEAERSRGMVASSAGNHAQGVAYAATKFGAKAHVVMPLTSPLIKVTATQGYGAEVILHGHGYDESYSKALELEKEKGYVFVHAFNDPLTMAGQGTLALEVLDAVPDLDSIIVPIGGGGLISGIATVIKAVRPQCKVYGVVSTEAPAMLKLFQGQPVEVPASPLTIADGIAVKKPTPAIYNNYLSRLVDDIVAISDDEIAEAIVWLLERSKTVVEGSGAIGLAAAFRGNWQLGEKSVVVLSGGNIDLNIISLVIERGLNRSGRLARIMVVVPDRPGALERLTTAIASERANILDVKHDRLRHDLGLSETAIEFFVETRSLEHQQRLRSALLATGARVI